MTDKFRNYLNYTKFFFRYHPMLALALLTDEIRGERKYRLDTTGFEKQPLNSIELASVYFAFSYMPSNYRLLEKVLKERNLYPHNKTFLDIGCGKGRVLIVAARFGFEKITGIELNEKFYRRACSQVTEQKEKYRHANFCVTCADAASYKIPPGVETIFLYNPFKEAITNLVLENILESLEENPRCLFIIYLNPVFKNNFIRKGFREIFKADRFHYLKASILCFEKNIKRKM